MWRRCCSALRSRRSRPDRSGAGGGAAAASDLCRKTESLPVEGMQFYAFYDTQHDGDEHFVPCGVVASLAVSL